MGKTPRQVKQESPEISSVAEEEREGG